MKCRITRMVGGLLALVATVFICHVSDRLDRLSVHASAFGDGHTPVPLKQLCRFATYLDTPSSLDACANRLGTIEGVKQQWAMDNGKKETDHEIVTWKDIEPYFVYGPPRFGCPGGGAYRIGRVGEAPICLARSHGFR